MPASSVPTTDPVRTPRSPRATAAGGATAGPAGPARVRIDGAELAAAAESLVDESGWEALTMTALAAAVGVKTPSLYHHVSGLDAVRAAVQVRAMAQLADELRAAAMGRTGTPGFRALADVHRSYAARYPNRYEALTRPPVDRAAYLVAGTGAAEAIAAMVGPLDLTGRGLWVELAAFAAIHGFIVLERSGFFGAEVDADHVFALVVEGAIASLHVEGDPP